MLMFICSLAIKVVSTARPVGIAMRCFLFLDFCRFVCRQGRWALVDFQLDRWNVLLLESNKPKIRSRCKRYRQSAIALYK